MKKLLSVLAICLLTTIANAQIYSWAKALSNPNWVSIYGSDVDSAGNVYTTGFFISTTDFDPGPGVFNLTPGVNGDAFIAKYDANGNLQWAQSFGSSGNTSDRGDGIAIDKAGFIYVTGSFRGTADLDPGPGILNFTVKGTNSNNGDVFVMKLTNAGSLVWVKIVGGDYDDESQYIDVDAGGNVIFLCKGNNTGDYDPGTGVYNVPGNGPIIVKLDANGNFVWAGTFENFTYSSSCWCNKFSLDGSGNIYLAGSFIGQWDFDPGIYNHQLNSVGGARDIYVCKLLSNGNYDWAVRAGGVGYEEATQITVDSAANVYVTGELHSDFDFDPGPGSDIVYHSGHGDAFLWKLSSTGTHQWVKQFKGTSSIFGDALDADKNNYVYLFGHFAGTMDVNPGQAIHQLTAGGNDDGFVAKFSPGGDQEWAVQTSTSTPTWLLSQTIHVCGEDQVVMTGSFSGTVDFDPGTAVNQLTGVDMNAGATQKNSFIWKLSKSDIISGSCFYDANGDGVRQSSEFGLSVPVKAMNANLEFHTGSDDSGVYFLRTDTGTYNVTVAMPSYYQAVLPASHTAALGSSYGATAGGKDFGLKPSGNINDLEVFITSLTPARPGRYSMYRLSYTNHGTTVLSGTVSLVLDNRMSLVSASPGISGQSGNVLTWNYSNLRPTQTGNIDVVCSLLVSTQPGIYLNYIAKVTPLTGDTTPLNNADTLLHLVMSSFDPNNKTVEPAGDIEPSFITQRKPLDYTIHFQNTGNDTAFVVIIRDTLSNLLDWSTLDMVAASHHYQYTMDKTGAIEWRFDKIMLPDSNVNEVRSHGFVRYRIQPKAGLLIGQAVKNRASIYFDFNLPVLTNETNTVLKLPTSVIEIAPGFVSRVYPNPAKGILYLETPGKFSYLLYDVSGRMIESREGMMNRATLSANKMTKGVYFLRVNTSKGNVTHKIMIE